MSYSFYDFNNALQQRNEYVEDRLRDGSPVVALSFPEGILLLSLRTSQRKLYEIYDRLAMGALGKQSDVESIRLAAIDTAHREGFQRSEDDVSIQRLVGFALSPAVKRIYNDQQAIPLTLRALFAEVNRTPEDDQFFTLGYDGEFRTTSGAAVAAGTAYAEEQAIEALRAAAPQNLTEALRAAREAWGIARTRLQPEPEPDENEEERAAARTPAEAIRDALADGAQVEAALLERTARRDLHFRLLSPRETEDAAAA